MHRLTLILLCLGMGCAPLRAADALAAVQLADAARVKATIAGDVQRLGELLTDDLLYGQNDGRVQTKTEFLNAVTSNQVKYEALEYQDTKLVETAPHVVTMTGLVHLKVSRGQTRVEFGVRFLAVWREDDGKWRLHAYQSARLPEPSTASAGKATP
ncbi:MAG: nuclear transport factor 2 family protein [Opitutaceae bacterium]